MLLSLFYNLTQKRSQNQNESIYLIIRREDKLEDDQQPDQSWLTVVKTKGHKKLLPTNQSSEQEKTEERVHLWRDKGK